MAGLSFKNIYKRYGNNPDTLRDVNLEIKHNEFVVFVGPSGCGKSTLLRMVAGLEEISSGELRIADQLVNDVPPAKRGVAMVFQSYALYPHMTVRENMAFGLRNLGGEPDWIAKKVNEAAKILHLDSLLDRLPKALSGGQRQRVAIGRAIVREPEVFLFDEPLSNLDAALRVQTRLEIAKLHREVENASMIYVTHDQVEAMTLADRIVLLHTGEDVQKHGSVAQFGTPLELYHSPHSLFVAGFIGSPKMNIIPAEFVSSTDGLTQVKIGSQAVQARVHAETQVVGSALHLGIRPEHSTLGAAEGQQSIPAVVQYIEQLGECSYIYVETEARKLMTIRHESGRLPQLGDRLNVGFAAQDVHLFDADGKAFKRSVELPV